MCRGLSRIVELELVRAAERAVGVVTHKTLSTGHAKAGSIQTASSMSSSLSSGGPTGRSTKFEEAILEKLESMEKNQHRVAELQGATDRRLESLVATVGHLKKGRQSGSSAADDDRNMNKVCIICKRNGHISSEYPLVLMARQGDGAVDESES